MRGAAASILKVAIVLPIDDQIACPVQIRGRGAGRLILDDQIPAIIHIVIGDPVHCPAHLPVESIVFERFSHPIPVKVAKLSRKCGQRSCQDLCLTPSR
jgi:hypothetical protein